MAGVAFAVEGDGVGFATESYAASALYTTLASLSGALWRIRWAKSLLCACSGSGERPAEQDRTAPPATWEAVRHGCTAGKTARAPLCISRRRDCIPSRT